MFTKRPYVVVCHGCGAFREFQSEFLSSPGGIGFDVTRDGGQNRAT